MFMKENSSLPLAMSRCYAFGFLCFRRRPFCPNPQAHPSPLPSLAWIDFGSITTSFILPSSESQIALPLPLPGLYFRIKLAKNIVKRGILVNPYGPEIQTEFADFPGGIRKNEGFTKSPPDRHVPSSFSSLGNKVQ